MEFPLFLFFAFELLLIISSSHLQLGTPKTCNNYTDVESLLAFKAHVNDPYGMLSTNWTADASFCSWIGITCSRRHERVSSIDLSSFSLQGTIPPHIANLSFLSYLNLRNNSLSGPIPESLAQLPRLTRVIFQNNQLFGTLPSSIFNMSKLVIIDFSHNNLTGHLPLNSNLTRLTQLIVFSVETNQLRGKISSNLAQCRSLQELYLANNKFSGIIPPELGNLSELAWLDLGRNQLTGTIPTSLGSLTSLEFLGLGWNYLEGAIPKELGNLRALQTLNLAKNGLTGSIPIALLNASMLNLIELAENNLTGSVPTAIGKSMPKLTCMHLGDNHLTGELSFIISLSNCKYLQSLGIGKNELRGVLPDSIGNVSMLLNSFDASMNYIHGNVPSTLGNLSGLLSLNLGSNELTGPIPTQLTQLKGLQAMYLQANRISGPLPFQMDAMESLGTLFIYENALTGEIPSSLSNITGLQYLGLDSNKLLSSIPQALWDLKSLIELNLASNALDGPLLPQVGNLIALYKLDLSNNRLYGNITSALGDLNMLYYLDLSNNSFSGQIPESLGKLVNIDHLNLSYNSLSGAIPMSLASPRHLNSLDLSYNRLEGKIPEGRVFANSSITSLVGNVALCGASQLKFQPCAENADISSSWTKARLLKYTLPAIGSIMIMLLCFIFLLKLYRKTNVKNPIPQSDPQCSGDYRIISYHELALATNNFNEANLLGSGSFGSVFKGCLNDGLLAAIKVLNLDVEGASKSFEAECRALSMLRHRNLVKIISACSNMDFKAIILQFMPNGSLEEWLYSDSNYLNIFQRINIMIDVSSALEYLHHHHSHVVVHCDIKPSNVLLDEDMVAHVGDFGIAKLFFGDSGQAISTSVLGTIGYMAPEYGSLGNVSRKGDVYSFGILLLETFTRKKPTDAMLNGELSLRKWVEKAYSTAVLEIVDGSLLRDDSTNERKLNDTANIHKGLSSIIDLGLLCSSNSAKDRIPMTEVVLRLQRIKTECFSD